MRSISIFALLAGLLGIAFAPAVFAGQQTGASGQATDEIDPIKLEAWRKALVDAPVQGSGCFHAQYPRVSFEPMPCRAAPVGAFSRPAQAKAPQDGSKTVGDGQDYVLKAPSGQIISRVAGSFPTVKGVTSVQTSGGAVPGANQYSLQLNTNDDAVTSMCDKRGSMCKVWQQFIYATQVPPEWESGSDPALFIEYWLLNATVCPDGWQYAWGGCVLNSPLVTVPNIPAADLDKVQLWGFANPGYDRALLVYGGHAYAYSNDASVVGMADVWRDAEFNVFGNAGGEADFNAGSTIDVRLGSVFKSLNYQVVPQCVLNAGTTGETNNLNLVSGSCKAWAYPNPANVGSPYIQFTESN